MFLNYRKILAGRYVRQQEVGVLGAAIALVVNRSRVGTALRYYSDINGFDIDDFLGKVDRPYVRN